MDSHFLSELTSDVYKGIDFFLFKKFCTYILVFRQNGDFVMLFSYKSSVKAETVKKILILNIIPDMYLKKGKNNEHKMRNRKRKVT